MDKYRILNPTLNSEDYRSSDVEDGGLRVPGYFEREQQGTLPDEGKQEVGIRSIEEEESKASGWSLRTDDIEVFDLDFSQREVKIVIIFMFFLDILINVDHGALPAALVALKHDVGLVDVQLGSLGSLVFVGLLFGSVCATFVLNRLAYKVVLGASFFGNGASLLLFSMTRSFAVMCVARFLSGFFQIFLTIYIPLYVDTFGTKTTKPIMLSLILLAPPIGVVTGYGITGTCISAGVDWRVSFIIQGATMAFCFFVILLIPNKLINIDDVNQMKREEKLQRLRRKKDEDISDEHSIIFMGEIGGTEFEQESSN